MSKTTPTRTYCKRNRPLPYYHPNCRTPRPWKFTQEHCTTQQPPIERYDTDIMLYERQSLVCLHVRGDNSRAFASGLSTVQAVKPCSILFVPRYPVQTMHVTRYLMLMRWVHVTGRPCYSSTLCATGVNVICGTGRNTNPRFRFKIKASYIVSTEGDIRRINNG